MAKAKSVKNASAPKLATAIGMPNINRTIRLEAKDYIGAQTPKDLIVLHHTVGATAKSTIDYWKSDPQRIATAFVIERNGEIYEVFDPKNWAFHLGLKGTGGAVDKRSIGIEIASEGGLIQRNGKLYCFDKVSDRTLFKQEYYDHGMPWRGYRFYDAYSEAQITAIIKLVNLLCKQFKIPKSTPANHLDADDGYRQFAGILGHHHLRPDKSDIHPGFPWQRVIDEVGLALL
jgi:N-acetyl-anhydromuramyl-L-alanine amidase AmpD